MRATFLVPKVLAFTLLACSGSVETNEQNDASVPDAAGDAADAGNCECTTDSDCVPDGICIECFCAFA